MSVGGSGAGNRVDAVVSGEKGDGLSGRGAG